MKKTLSIILSLVMALALCLSFASCGEETSTEPGTSTDDSFTVGIVQLVQHDALDAATQGFKDALTKEFGDKVTFDYQNASGDSATCSTIVNSFVSKNVDLIMANATPALQAAASATETIPVLGTSITEYGVALEIKDFNGTVGGNVSGTSDLAPLDEQAQMIIDLFPETKTVGIIYCSAEVNSEYQVKTVEKYLTDKGITVTRYSFSDTNDIAAVTNSAVAASDVIYIPTDNKAADAAETIGNIVREAKKPVIAGEEGICSKCGVATLSISYYDLGVKTGEMAVKILKGESKIAEMEIEYAPTTKKYNKTIAEELGVAVPEGFEAIGG